MNIYTAARWGICFIKETEVTKLDKELVQHTILNNISITKDEKKELGPVIEKSPIISIMTCPKRIAIECIENPQIFNELSVRLAPKRSVVGMQIRTKKTSINLHQIQTMYIKYVQEKYMGEIPFLLDTKFVSTGKPDTVR